MSWAQVIALAVFLASSAVRATRAEDLPGT
jgi:hypothetical protein